MLTKCVLSAHTSVVCRTSLSIHFPHTHTSSHFLLLLFCCCYSADKGSCFCFFPLLHWCCITSVLKFYTFFVCYPNTHYCSLCSTILTFNTYIYVPQTQNIFILFSPLLPSWFFLPMNDLHMVFLCNSISKQFSYCIQMYKSECYCIRY